MNAEPMTYEEAQALARMDTQPLECSYGVAVPSPYVRESAPQGRRLPGHGWRRTKAAQVSRVA